ncbi:MAG: hypothetical protein HY681_03035 [Chloroflexi bacterium]|nr:hypothetical protein [Chloroflexota bacterium]
MNHAGYGKLLRVPGVGPAAARRIVAQRRRSTINTWRDLQAMGVVAKRAKAFLGFPGYKPEKAHQMKLELLSSERPKSLTAQAFAPAPQATHAAGCASCAGSGCGGCPVATLKRARPASA